jgi:hypothetical protein
MKKILILTLILSGQVYATCMLQKTVCSPDNNFQNTYELEKVSCAAPGGPVRTTETFLIYNPLANNNCSPVASRGCHKPIFKRNLNTTRHYYLQVEIQQRGQDVFLKIDDRAFLPQGSFHISTPNNDFKLLTGYTCKFRHR